MKKRFLLTSIVAVAICAVSIAQVAYEIPEGGWTYVYEGDELQAIEGDPDQILDGSWVEHSGKWDFLELGDPLSTPGGLAIDVDADGVTFLRIQDAGEPRDFALYEDINRKLHFGHDLTQDGLGAGDALLDDGVTLGFRMKVPLDDGSSVLESVLWPADGLWAVEGVEENPPYPAEGDGYYASEGLGMVGINQGDGTTPTASVGFSLMTTFDDDTIATTGEGLYMNMGAGAVAMEHPSLRDIQEDRAPPGSAINVVPCTPTEWNEFWVTIVADGVIGTHEVSVWINGDVASPAVFNVTASTKNHQETNPYAHIGFMNSGENGAMDLDYYGIKAGIVAPVASSVGTFDMSFAGTQLKCYPNPSNGEATFAFNLKRDGYTTLEVYNLIGQPVAKVLSKDLPAGAHNIQMNVDLAPGQYVYRLQSGDQNEISKMTILK